MLPFQNIKMKRMMVFNSLTCSYKKNAKWLFKNVGPFSKLTYLRFVYKWPLYTWKVDWTIFFQFMYIPLKLAKYNSTIICKSINIVLGFELQWQVQRLACVGERFYSLSFLTTFKIRYKNKWYMIKENLKFLKIFKW